MLYYKFSCTLAPIHFTFYNLHDMYIVHSSDLKILHRERAGARCELKDSYNTSDRFIGNLHEYIYPCTDRSPAGRNPRHRCIRWRGVLGKFNTEQICRCSCRFAGLHSVMKIACVYFSFFNCNATR